MSAVAHRPRPLPRGALESPAVTARDRLVTTLFFAALIHGVIILGITFTPDTPSGSATLEVTMVQTRSMTPPSEADYIAQVNQQGEGNTRSLVRPESPLSMPAAVNNTGRPEAPDLVDNAGRNAAAGSDQNANRSSHPDHPAVVTTTALTGMTANAQAAAPMSVQPEIMVARLLTPGDDALMPSEDGLELPQARATAPTTRRTPTARRQSPPPRSPAAAPTPAPRPCP